MKAAGSRGGPSPADVRRRAQRVARRLVFTFARAVARPGLPAVDLPLDVDAPTLPLRDVDLFLELDGSPSPMDARRHAGPASRPVDILLEVSEAVPRRARRLHGAAFERSVLRAWAPGGRPAGGRTRGRGRGEKVPGEIDEGLH